MKKDFRKEFINRLENDYLYDSDILTILLYNAFSGLDADKLVKNLLHVFPSVSSVLDADLTTLMMVQGMTRQVSEYIVSLGKAKGFLYQSLTEINDSEQLIGYAMDRCRGNDCEGSELYCVNRNGKVIAYHSYKSNHMKKVELDFRTVSADITSSGASGFYLLHNHVYGSVHPSENDDIFTTKLLSVFSQGDIEFIDHCIVSEREGYSYLKSGRLSLLKEGLK